MSEVTMGRRERKKAATRKALADAALELFLERGFDEVSVKEIADAADVSTTTLFKHFPSKESLVFDEDLEQDAAVLDAVRNRDPGKSIVRALREHLLTMRTPNTTHPRMAELRALVEDTPALMEQWRRTWMRHEVTLAHAIAEDLGVPGDDPTCVALAHFVLSAGDLARGHADPRAGIEPAFELLEYGWQATQPTTAGAEQPGNRSQS